MATKSDCPPPVVIGGVKITQKLIESLNVLQEDNLDDMHFFTDQCLILSSIDLEKYGLSRHLFVALRNMYEVLRALHEGEKGEPS